LFLYESQQNIVSQSYPLMIVSSCCLLGYSFISHRFHSKHDLPIRCCAGTVVPLHSPGIC
jgi:hypothetical protein